MIRRTICGPESGSETGCAAVAVRNRWKEARGKALRADSVFLPGSLVAAERKQLVLDDRTAQHTAELILIQDLPCCRAGSVVTIVEEGLGIKIRVSEILKCRSVELIRSSFRDDV